MALLGMLALFEVYDDCFWSHPQFLHGVTSALNAAICVVMLLLIAHINLSTIHTYIHTMAYIGPSYIIAI